jgi:hypothetical protein
MNSEGPACARRRGDLSGRAEILGGPDKPGHDDQKGEGVWRPPWT